MALTKNIGQVSGLFIGTQPPSNRTLIWFDSTPAIKAHKVYNTALSAWVMLDNTVISNITYSELAGIASGSGLTQGAWYKITDRGNALALAITSTKIQYVDLNGNFIIDDLVASAIYVVNSNNLYIDDQQGVWDAQNHQLKFNFTQVTLDADSGTDFVYGRRTRLGVTTFVKYTLQSLVSAVTGNSITWNQGLYFNFLSELASQMDVEGGVVSKHYFDTNFMQMQTSYNNLADSINDMYTDIQTMVQNLTTNQAIYDKQMPYQMVPGTAAEILTGDTLGNIVQKCQRWFDQLRYSTGIEVGPNFTPAASEGYINSADDVFEAFRKVQKALNNRQAAINAINSILNPFIESFEKVDAFNVHFSHPSSVTDPFQVGAFITSGGKLFMQVNGYRNFYSNNSQCNMLGSIPMSEGYKLPGNNQTNIVGFVRRVSGYTNISVQILIRNEVTTTQSFSYNLVNAEIYGVNVLPYLSSTTPSIGSATYNASIINFDFIGLPTTWNFANSRGIVLTLDTTI